MDAHGPEFTLTPQPYAHDGARVRFDCLAVCGCTPLGPAELAVVTGAVPVPA